MRDSTLAMIFVWLIVALLNLAAHWFPWQVIPGAEAPAGGLRRLLAYGYGVATIVAGMAGWAGAYVLAGRVVVSPWMALVALVGIVVAAGAGTLAAYAIDLTAEARALAGDVADLEKRIGGL